MNKLYSIVWWAAAILGLAACQEREEGPMEQGTEPVPAGYRVERLQVVYPAETRTAFDDGTGRFSWMEGDSLAFHLSDGSYLTVPVDPASGSVTLRIREGLVRDQYAVYPASAVVADHAVAGDLQVVLPPCYDISADVQSSAAPLPMVADNDPGEEIIRFRHLGALLQVNVTAPAGTRSVRVSLGRRITGVFDVAEGDAEQWPWISTDDLSSEGLTFRVSGEGLAQETPVKLQVPVPSGDYPELGLAFSDGRGVTDTFHKEHVFSFSRSAGKKVSIQAASLVDERDYFWFEALEAGSTVGFKPSATSPVVLYCSTDGKRTWTEWDQSTITLQEAGDTVFFYGTSDRLGQSYGGTNYANTFTGTGNLKVGGDIMTLVNPATGRCGFYKLFYNLACLSDAALLRLPRDFGEEAFNAYEALFKGCTSLTEAPELPATELVEGCYQEMFHGCKALVSAPELPAEEMATACYWSMFYGCTSLTRAPDLPARNLAPSCYGWMFWGCTSLVEGPSELPAEELAASCYICLFKNCSALPEGPSLPARAMQPSCYSQMFYGCKALASAPALPATDLATRCYESMFYGCSSLPEAPDLPAETLAEECYASMFQGCTALTRAPALPADRLARKCYYQLFRGCTGLTAAPELPALQMEESAYESLFYGCTALKTPPSLPAGTLAKACYKGMFFQCRKLASAPSLPVGTLAEGCYQNLFAACTSLKVPPALPAQNLAKSCYQGMFDSCSALTQAPALPAADLAAYCYASMFLGCSALTGAPDLPAATLKPYCYQKMFYGCSALPAATLGFTDANYAYACDQMFYNCKKLAEISVRMTAWPTVTTALTKWVSNVAAAGSFTKPSALETVTGVGNIPAGWEVYNEEDVSAGLG